MLFAPALLALAVQTPAQTSTTLADLVPKGTVAFIQSPSLERAAKFVGRMTNAFAPAGGQTIDVAKLLAMIELPGDAAAVDSARPVGVCLVLGEGGQPLPAFLIPVRDGDAFLKSIEKPGSPMKGVAKGGYACIGFGAAPEPPSTPAAIAKGLPEGELAVRLDLGRLIEQFREQIDQGLDAIEAQAGSASAATSGGIDPAPIIGPYMDGLRDVIDSAETLDLAARLDGDELELGFTLTNAEGSALANFGSKEKTGVRALAPLLDQDASLSLVMGMDMPAMLKRFQPLFDAMPNVYPEGLRPSMKLLFDHMGDFYGLLGNAQCVSMDFASTGIRYCAYIACKDPQKLLAAYRQLVPSMLGCQINEIPEREVGGLKVEGFHIKFDFAELMKKMGATAPSEKALPEMDAMMERMFGKGGFTLQVASKGDLTVLILGGDDDYLKASIAKLSSKPALAPFLVRPLQQVGDLSPCFAMRYDLGRMMKGLKGMLAGIGPAGSMDLPDLPISISAWGGINGRVWRGALSTSLSGVHTAIQSTVGGRYIQAQRVKATTDIAAMMASLDEYAINNGGKYPDSLEPLVVPDKNGNAYLEGYNGKVPKDPWKNEYQYEAPTKDHSHPRIISFGSDGVPGGTGDAADIDSDRIRDEK